MNKEHPYMPNKKGITVNLRGGLGNQMFEYAAARRIAHANKMKGIKLYLNYPFDIRNRKITRLDFALYIFRLNKEIETYRLSLAEEMLARIFPKLFFFFQKIKGRKPIFEKHFHVNKDIIEHPPTSGFLSGWWQSEQYFKDIEPIIREEFSFKEPLLDLSKDLALHIRREEDAVCLHARRGDYITSSTKMYDVTTIDYFKNAAHKMASYFPNAHFFVFSDDIEWCIKNIDLPYPITFVDDTHSGNLGVNHFQLMTLCKHFIISNSTFSWWAAWLGVHPGKKIIAPQSWYADPNINTTDILPASWEKLPV